MTSVTIIGAGIFGLCCAWELLNRGADVHVIEATSPGAGASGGHIGALAPHAPENWNPKKAFQLDSLRIADCFWADIARIAQRDPGYARSGRLQPVADAQIAERLSDRIAAARQRWPNGMAMALIHTPEPGIPATGASDPRAPRIPAGALIPASPSGIWLWDGLTARINPRAALATLTDGVRARGGQITTGHTATPDDPDLRNRNAVLWTTGTQGLHDLNRDLNRNIGTGVKGQSALLAHPTPADSPQILTEGLHIVPHADGTVAIGSTSENSYDHDRTDDQITALIARARTACPALSGAAVIETWAGIRPRARTRAPLLGPWPGRPGHYVANGGFKIGFGMAPAIGAVMADLIVTGTDRIPDGFRLG